MHFIGRIRVGNIDQYCGFCWGEKKWNEGAQKGIIVNNINLIHPYFKAHGCFNWEETIRGMHEEMLSTLQSEVFLLLISFFHKKIRGRCFSKREIMVKKSRKEKSIFCKD